MSTFKIMLRAYKNDKFLKISTIAFFVIVFFGQSLALAEYFMKNSDTGIKYFPSIINDLFYIAEKVSFFFFLFASYYFFNLKNKFMFSELLPVNKKFFLFLNQAAILSLLVLLYIFIFTLINTVIILYSGYFECEYILFVLKLTFLDGFLNPLLAVFIGAVPALNKNKIKAAFLILLTAALTLPPVGVFFANVMTRATDAALWLFWLGDYFHIFLSNPFEYYFCSYRFQLSLAWICFFLFINLRGCFNLNKTVFKGVATVLPAGSLCFFIWFSLPASRIEDEAYWIGRDDYAYYEKIDSKKETADFKVTDYDMKFKIKRNLSAKATLTLDKNELSEYKFTLYHGYKVKKVTDENGKKLEFTQEADYVTVYSDKALSKITMFYSGSGGRYYSNSEVITLPGFFPFYPQSGYKKLYEEQMTNHNILTLEEKANFNVKTDTPKKVYCNLNEIAPGEFSGYAESLCMVASGYYKQTDVNGVGYIRECFVSEDFNQIEKDISENIKNGVFPSDLKKIIKEQNFAQPFVAYSDYVNVDTINPEWLKEYTSSFKKHRAYMWVRMYTYYPDGYYGFLEKGKKEADFEQSDLYFFNECVNKYGAEFTSKNFYEYMNDKNDERDSLQFLKDLFENAE